MTSSATPSFDIAIAAAIGSEGEGQYAAAPQHEMQIMVHATRSTIVNRIFSAPTFSAISAADLLAGF